MKQILFGIGMILYCLLLCTELQACEQSSIQTNIISQEYLTPSNSIEVAVILRFKAKAQLYTAPTLTMAGEKYNTG